MNAAVTLQQELWAFVESLAVPSVRPLLSPEARLEQIQQQAGDLLARGRETLSINGTAEFPVTSAAEIVTSNGEGDLGDTKDEARKEVVPTTEAEEKPCTRK